MIICYYQYALVHSGYTGHYATHNRMFFRRSGKKKAIIYLPGSVGDNFIMLALAQQLKDADFGDIAIMSNVAAPIYKKITKSLGISDDVFSAKSISSLIKAYISSFVRDTYFVFILTPDAPLISYMSFVFYFFSPTKIVYCLYTDIHKKPKVFGRCILCTEQDSAQVLFKKIFDRLSLNAESKPMHLSLPKLIESNYCIFHTYPSHMDDRVVEKEVIKKGLSEYYASHPDISKLIICTGTMGDRLINENFDDYIPKGCTYLDLRGMDNLFGFMHMIHDCDRYFGVHTGPTQIAAMFQKKGLIFFKRYRPFFGVEYNKNFDILLLDKK